MINANFVIQTAPELQAIVRETNELSVDPNAPLVNNTGLPLADAIEELSKNITISLFSSSQLLQGADSITTSYAP